MKRYLIAILALVSVISLATVTTDVTSARMGPDRSGVFTTAGPAVMLGPIEIPINRVTSGREGQERTLAIRNVPNGEYDVSVVATGQEATHPGSDIIVRSNSSEVVIEDVSNDTFTEETAEGTLTVSNGIVRIYVKLGSDAMFSGGVSVILTPVPGQLDNSVLTAAGGAPIAGVTGDLPKAGISGVLTGGALGMGILAFTVHRWLTSRARLGKTLSKLSLTTGKKRLQSLLNAARLR
jgi:hypothetical protein